MKRYTKGTVVVLKDKQSLSEAIASGKAVTEVRTIITDTEFIKNDLCEYHVYTLRDHNLTLIIQLVDDVVEYCIYFPVEEFATGNRGDMFDNGQDWLFEETNPDEVDDLDDILYRQEIPSDDGDFITSLGAVWGESDEGYMAGVCEWKCTNDIANPYLIVTEIGDLISLFQGCEVDDSEVEFMEL